MLSVGSKKPAPATRLAQPRQTPQGFATLSKNSFEVLRWRPKAIPPRAEFASFLAVRISAARDRATAFVWPEEGELENAVFRFSRDFDDLEPVIIHPAAARGLVAAHDALTGKEQGLFEAAAALRRSAFAHLVHAVIEDRRRGV